MIDFVLKTKQGYILVCTNESPFEVCAPPKAPCYFCDLLLFKLIQKIHTNKQS